MSNSRIGGLHKLSIVERVEALGQRGWLSDSDVELLKSGRHVLLPATADRMVENVVAAFGLPLAIAPNFIVNGHHYIVPMVVEEPSVVAAVSAAAKLACPDGFAAHSDESLIAGQIHVTDLADAERAVADLRRCEEEILELANAVHPGLARHGGGVRELEIRTIELPDTVAAIALHVLVDTGDAMGANIVNTICESLAPRIGEICGGNIAMRILSNLSDRSLVEAKVRYRVKDLATTGFAAEEVRDRIVMASDIAAADPYRAATHNKGIMNGIDALALATGNDWRAIEAGAHAFAATTGRYLPLSRWYVDAAGDLHGELSMPLRVATVGGTLQSNPAAKLALRMTGVSTARELTELMAAVGLAQNFAAIKALATRGIQEGHMRLHARHKVVASESAVPFESPAGSAAGKIILLGEHAVVYGKHALALPIADAVGANIIADKANTDPYCQKILRVVRQELAIDDDQFGVDVRCQLPTGMGLGSSAAIAVAIIRAVNHAFELDLSDERINSVALACEKIAHGTPSGIDNSIATYAVPMLFNNKDGLQIDELEIRETPPILIAFSNQPGQTHEQVAGVRKRYQDNHDQYERVFEQIDAISLAGTAALQKADYDELGALMNLCHGLLNAIEVSTPEIEKIVSLARAAGASGAKLTGGGGGGSIIALCPGVIDDVRAALGAAGFESLALTTTKDG
ncbi:MAG: hydroxymethylglutaryl-CoA reductase, degradative [Woeseiaceae bacterium]